MRAKVSWTAAISTFSFIICYDILIHTAVADTSMKGGVFMSTETIIFSIVVNVTCGVIAAYIYNKYVK